jgi:hypothetical protein
MAVNVMEYMTKFQEEGLAAIKQTQEASLKAMSTWRELGREMSEKPGTVPTLENMPTPTQFVEFSFGFASQLLELRKAWTLRMAEMIVEAQKQTEATVKAATATMNQNVNQNLGQNLNQNPNKPVNPSK